VIPSILEPFQICVSARARSLAHLFPAIYDDERGSAGLGVLVPDETGWAIVHEKITPKVTLDELGGVGVWEKQLVSGNGRGRAGVRESTRGTSARCHSHTSGTAASSGTNGNSGASDIEVVNTREAALVPHEASGARENGGVA